MKLDGPKIRFEAVMEAPIWVWLLMVVLVTAAVATSAIGVF